MEKKARKNIMILPKIWKLAETMAKKENRSTSNYIECLIIADAEKKNIKGEK